ncbi:MAG: RNA-binding transcriptional accessory protein [Acidobacteria bacterium]|nr:MAG: RNA-binding transcriptional accessory protein [Acidobacteriota bacterium]
MFSPELLLRISKEVSAQVARVEATLKLLDEGATVPFIARYRKEATGNLDDVKIRDIDERGQYYAELEARRATILNSIEKQEKLTDDLRSKILACFSKSELEDLYLPYKPKRKTKAAIAIERGLEPLANYLWEQTGEQPAGEFAERFINLEREILTIESAIEGALHIIAERVAETPEFRKQLRDAMMTEGVVRAKVVTGKETEKTKYEMYYDFQETVAKIPSHRMLAIRRGTREGILNFSIDIDNTKFIVTLLSRIIRDPQSRFAPFLDTAVRDAYDRLLLPSIQNEVRSILKERAESEAIQVFEENLRTLLLAPPAGHLPVVGIDPGQRTGCKVAVVDETGKFLENQTIYPTEPKRDLEGSEKTVLDLIQRHNVRGVAIGNGTASRETDTFVRSVVEKNKLDVFVIVVSEAGASIYSASKRAREEFPKLDVTVRGAISIARRLQDPLAELVKTDPKSIGVGQYQHDVDQKKLKKSLAAVVESCVNRVGVDLNSASIDLLKYVSGIGDKLAQNIVAYRDDHGLFRSRTQLREIEGFGEKTFEQAAGFLRIKDAENLLDRTAVHPESYPLVERMAASLGISINELIENPAKINAIDFKTFEAEGGRYTVNDIREELLKPGRDPREKFVVPKFREDVKEIGDLKDGMELEGTVTNVTNFGAFVDLGVHQDGLVHISELSHKYVQDARQAVKVGEIVKVKVIGVDAAMKRISLSMKAIMPKPPRRIRPKRKPQIVPVAPVAAMAAEATGSAKAFGAPRPKKPPERRPQAQQKQQTRPPRPPVEAVPPPKQTMEEKIRLLQEKFGRAR